jgi:DNA-binding winged helix-turn-helix (wHTH) protein
VTASSSAPAGARFDRFSVDLSSGGLFCSGVRVPIQGQPFQVLRLLLEARGKVVTREELRQALWPEDTFVDFELGVNTAVKKLRQALRDSAEHPKFIETLPKYGYRFIVPVEWENGNSEVNALPSVEAIAPPAAAPLVSRTLPRKPPWQVKAVLGLATLAAAALLVSLSDENSYLSHARLGRLARRVVFGPRTIAQAPVG